MRVPTMAIEELHSILDDVRVFVERSREQEYESFAAVEMHSNLLDDIEELIDEYEDEYIEDDDEDLDD
jgi:vacuolar-type H+-ATPase subunit E/Vma4